MQNPYYHVNQPGECPVCGLSFEHMHTDKNKPKEFIRGLTTKNPPERVEQKEWWMKYAEGNWVGLSSVEKIIAEAVARRDAEILERVEGMKYDKATPMSAVDLARDMTLDNVIHVIMEGK